MKAFLVSADVASLLFAIWFSAALKFDAVIRYSKKDNGYFGWTIEKE
jgi:hypothetical protein